ncbi:putative transferase CAF17 homolog, mitochondrial [Aplysia californica]|uniref:Transferase CAF17 homolog, mitochondrial n=1 Tax=Aplysia californica TaxID=6500 RepID=A0ABM0JD05_APLCA|nr:putative transferase CAF17 homolog, mitochondrial [Aplysia californica]XP_005090881.1 putative transferase CAF17 homolog, mitochondrial [Aplysia californica]XP_035828257.1 putative transferase CAF17 homolog, mitochondrial [Aplysia californica]
MNAHGSLGPPLKVMMTGLSQCLWRKLASKIIHRHFHTSNKRSVHAACKLSTRGVLRLSGKDTASFLQGLVTNDVQQLVEKSPSIQYSMMLNVQGRVLYDLFLCNVSEGPDSPMTVLVDVDSTVRDELAKIFKKYKLRKKVDISDVTDEYTVWSEFQTGESSEKSVTPSYPSDAFCFHDPRVPVFANRILTHGDNIGELKTVDEKEYRVHRYLWGIPEGVNDLPPGNCLPLESNLAFMNGVNFQKGCYIGQELTARTFHTGVTRKRLMPLTLDSDATIDRDSTISTEKGKNAGKFRSNEGTTGLGLLRLAHVKDTLSVMGSDGQSVTLTCEVPSWWPANVVTASSS